MSETTNLIISIVTIVAAFALFVVACIDKKRFSARSIAYGAICLALSLGLSYIRLFRMPQGGSVTPAAMLPVMMFAYIFGTKKGILLGLAYAGLQSIQDLFFVHPLQYILDYPLAFMVLGLVGLSRYIPELNLKDPGNETKLKKSLYDNFNGYPIGFPVGIIVVYLLRYACHVLSGVVFFAENAGSENVWIYSLGYNSFVWVECAICVAAGSLLLTNKSARKFLFKAQFTEIIKK